jgi:hypothetical protein
MNLFDEDVFIASSGLSFNGMDLIAAKCGFDKITHCIRPKDFGCIDMQMSFSRNEAIEFVVDEYGFLSTQKMVELVKETSAYQKNLERLSDVNGIAVITTDDLKAVGKKLFENNKAPDLAMTSDMSNEVKNKNMSRKDITKFLGDLLINERFRGMSKYWASEVSLDYGTAHVRRVDFMQFCPVNQIDISGIEKGIFICYEVKSCKSDFKSGFGQNFVGEKNYFVMPMSVYKELAKELPHGVGVLVPIPSGHDKYNEFENPTPLDKKDVEWELATIKNAFQVGRQRPMNELLFCMLRAGH